MRIAIIKSNYTPYGGAEKYTIRLINAFAERGAEVDLLTTESGKWDHLNHKVRPIYLKQLRYNNLLRLLTFNHSANNYLKKENYDCILGMDRTEFQTHLRAGGGCHAAWIERRCVEKSMFRCLSFKVNPFHRAMIGIEQKAIKNDKLKRIFCNSTLVKEEILHYYPSAEHKLMVVHNGVEWDEFSVAFGDGLSKRNYILDSIGLDPDKFYYLFVGSGYERKGLIKAIKALLLLPEYTELLVVGKDKHENLYKTICKKSGIERRVHFFSSQRDVIPFLQISDAFVLPTIYDPFSNASLEAMAMGLYTITSDANGCAEVIKNGAGSIIRDLKDIDFVAEAMNAALGGHLSRNEIRDTVKHLDFYVQLKKIVDVCLSDSE